VGRVAFEDSDGELAEAAIATPLTAPRVTRVAKSIRKGQTTVGTLRMKARIASALSALPEQMDTLTGATNGRIMHPIKGWIIIPIALGGWQHLDIVGRETGCG
jgi:hypothetical protein